MENNKEIRQGLKAALPVIMGYVPIGLAFGVMAVQAGLKVWQVLLMSLFVYAGSAQFIAASLWSAGASAGTIVLTTFLVNSRHFLLSASLAPYMKNIPGKILALIGYETTDETFAVAINAAKERERTASFYLGLNSVSHLVWTLSTVIGAAVGNLIPSPDNLGLNFALPAMFIGLLIMQVQSRNTAVIAILAAGLSLFCKLLLPGSWNIIIAGTCIPVVGVVLEKWSSRYTQSSSA